MNVIAIDTGLTKIAGAVVDKEGRIVEKGRWVRKGNGPTPKHDTMDVYREIVQTYKQHYEVAAVGVGAGGRVDVKTGMFNFGTGGPNTGWYGVNIIKEVEEFAECTVAIENDCKAAMIGECWKGATKDYDTVLGAILGTGYGGGYMYLGKMVYGGRYGAGELGHGILYPDGRKCFCGQNGCAEMYCSGTALWQGYNEHVGRAVISTGYEFFKLIEANDSVAKRILDKFSHDLALTLVSYANLFDPEVILVGGGLTDTAQYWWDDMLKYYRQEGIWFVQKIPIVKCALGNDAALLGAAKIALDALNSK